MYLYLGNPSKTQCLVFVGLLSQLWECAIRENELILVAVSECDECGATIQDGAWSDASGSYRVSCWWRWYHQPPAAPTAGQEMLALLVGPDTRRACSQVSVSTPSMSAAGTSYRDETHHCPALLQMVATPSQTN